MSDNDSPLVRALREAQALTREMLERNGEVREEVAGLRAEVSAMKERLTAGLGEAMPRSVTEAVSAAIAPQQIKIDKIAQADAGQQEAMKALLVRIEKVEDTQKWFGRLLIGAIVSGAVALVVAWAKVGG